MGVSSCRDLSTQYTPRNSITACQRPIWALESVHGSWWQKAIAASSNPTATTSQPGRCPNTSAIAEPTGAWVQLSCSRVGVKARDPASQVFMDGRSGSSCPASSPELSWSIDLGSRWWTERCSNSSDAHVPASSRMPMEIWERHDAARFLVSRRFCRAPHRAPSRSERGVSPLATFD